MLRICLPLATLGLLSSAELAPPIPDSTPLTHAPFIMTHDAGSGYLGAGLVNGAFLQ